MKELELTPKAAQERAQELEQKVQRRAVAIQALKITLGMYPSIIDIRVMLTGLRDDDLSKEFRGVIVGIDKIINELKKFTE